LADDSKTTDVGSRYAQALFDLAVETNGFDAVDADMRSLKAMLAESEDLRRMIASPAFGAEDKARALAAVASAAQFSPTTMKFIGVVAKNGRASSLPAAIRSFQQLAAKRRGTVAAEVTTAIQLTPEQMSGLQAALRQALGKDPEIETRVDPSLLGGMKVRVGSRLYDASLRSKLDQLKFALKRA
jgi:F-type H+-transporting ATPase subunit delta